MTTTIKEESLTASIPTPIDRNAREASVQVLTAEVRTLIVGSRQVTLSVYKQLDETAPEDIEPFGRVRTVTRFPFAVIGLIEVIGSAYGHLARSVVRDTRFLCENGGSSEGGRVTYNGTDAIFGRCLEHQLPGPSKGHFWYDHHDRYGEWEQLPLIVLAGLR